MSEPIKFDDYDSDEEEDSQTTKTKKRKPKSDFVSMSSNLLFQINFKMGGILFLLGMIIMSHEFMDGFLHHIDGAVDGVCATSKGTIIQLTVFVLCYLVLDLLNKAEWI